MRKEGASDDGQTDLAFLSRAGTLRPSLDRECLLIICVGVSVQTWQGERDEGETRSSPSRRGGRWGWGSWKSQVVWGRSDETQPPQRENLSENEGHRWAGREGRAKTVTEKRRGSCQSLTLLPALPCLLGWVGSATLRHGERLPNPSLRFDRDTVITSPSNKRCCGLNTKMSDPQQKLQNLI